MKHKVAYTLLFRILLSLTFPRQVIAHLKWYNPVAAKNCGGGLMPAGDVVIKYNWLYFYFYSSGYRYDECLHYSNCNSGCHNIILVIDKEVNSNTYAYLINGYIVIAL